MKITLQQELQPFGVPNYVIAVVPPRPRQEGVVEAPKYRLGELDDETLEMLCDRFRADVFAMANEQRGDSK